MLSFKWETQGWAQDESTRGGGSQGSLAGLPWKGKAKGLTSLVGSRTDFTFFLHCVPGEMEPPVVKEERLEVELGREHRSSVCRVNIAKSAVCKGQSLQSYRYMSFNSMAGQKLG